MLFFLKQQKRDNFIEYGWETYYIPESQWDGINSNISQAQRSRQQQSVVVEAKVDAQGRVGTLWCYSRLCRFSNNHCFDWDISFPERLPQKIKSSFLT
ncbi:MAG: GDYXXLXY domain-containing protein [Aphanothece sp. CMT-3BRIN-NPC111]|nr:GDYXXLXY domain-containing protein [Aphanothece sp. CMT-3BRIN-NPC111]